VSPLSIRTMTRRDLPFADALRREEGWNQTLADWERLLEHQPRGCFLAAWNERPAGVVTTTVHEGILGWIGMMLVSPEFRRRGIATALIEHSLEELTKQGVACIKLDATPAGQTVYERLGFQAEWAWQRRERPGTRPPEVLVGGDSWNDENYAWDAEVFGADRREWLARVARPARVICRGHGFGMLRPGSNAGYLGPIAARDPGTAEEIVLQLLNRVDGRIIWDLPDQNRAGVQLAESLGFQAVRDLVRMWTGSRLLAGQPDRQYGFADPGTG
jgi:GNAT superfamily N-acetyltransferase